MQTPPAPRFPRPLILTIILATGCVLSAAYSTVMAVKMRQTIAEIGRLNTACDRLSHPHAPAAAERECTPGMTLHPGESCTKHIIIELGHQGGSI